MKILLTILICFSLYGCVTPPENRSMAEGPARLKFPRFFNSEYSPHLELEAELNKSNQLTIQTYELVWNIKTW